MKEVCKQIIYHIDLESSHIKLHVRLSNEKCYEKNDSLGASVNEW